MINETKQELDLTKDKLLEILNETDEEIVEANEGHLKQQDHTYNYSFNKSKNYRRDNDSD